MKNLKLLPLFLLICALSFACCETDKQPQKVLRHVVLFGFDSTVTANQVKEIEEAF